MEHDNNEYAFGDASQQEGGVTDYTYGGQDGSGQGSPYESPNYGPSDYTYGGSGSGQSNSTYGSPNYGSSDYTYGGQSYGQAGGPYGGQSYGQPPQNRFGMKLTFSILEILCCCGCNIVTMIMGIIGCVFTTKANNAYKEGRWEDFKSEARTSAVCLWIGFGIAVIYLIGSILAWTVGGIGDAFMEGFWEGYYGYSSDSDHTDSDDSYDEYDYDYDYGYSDEDTDTEEEREPLDITPGTGFDDPTITVNGITVSLPLAYSEFRELGFYVDTEDEDYVLNKDEYRWPDLYGPDGEMAGSVYIGNPTGEALASKECVVFGFWFTSSDFNYYDVAVSFANGLTEEATSEDFITAFGEPDYVDEDGEFKKYQWYSFSEIYENMEENSLSAEFWEDELDTLDLMYIGWD